MTDIDTLPEQRKEFYNYKRNALQQEVEKAFGPAPPSELHVLNREQLLSQLQKLAETNYPETVAKEKHDRISTMLAQKSMAVKSPSLALGLMAGMSIPARMLAVYATEEQKRKYLKPLLRGSASAAIAISETGMSIENGPLLTFAKNTDENIWILQGEKNYIWNAPLADFFVVAAETDQGPAWFILDRDTVGLERGPADETLGFRGSAIGSLTMDACRLDRNQIIGPFPNRDSLAVLREWQNEALISIALGLIKRCYDTALPYAKQHKSGGKPIISYQEVGFKLAEIMTLDQTAQLLAMKAAWAKEADNRDADALLGCAKVFCCEAAEKTASECLQIMGGAGYMKDNPVAESFQDAKYLTIAGVSSEISRMMIADSVLAMY
ncbi:MAG: hypothetical protein GWP07_07470 [Xanthomonadaceae bacterium]|nr:hypothetical protein [Xanthomonadaceae bacterium]